MSQYLGDISAYALAVSQGYTGTEEEYAELMASYATVGQTAVTAAQTATTKASEAATSATTAANKATEATTAATTATTKAGEASTSASTATSAKDTAVSASQTATTKATEATAAAATATSAATTATTAKDDAVSAKTAAQTAQTGAETAAASVQSSAAQIATNTDDIAQLKSDLSDVRNTIPDIDSTLSTAGKAADAKKTGDEIEALKSNFTASREIIFSKNRFDPSNVQPGFVNQVTGEWVPGSSTYSGTPDMVDVLESPFTIALYPFSYASNVGLRYAVYDADGTYITGKVVDTSELTVVYDPSTNSNTIGYIAFTNPNIRFIRFSMVTAYFNTIRVQIAKRTTPTDYTKYTGDHDFACGIPSLESCVVGKNSKTAYVNTLTSGSQLNLCLDNSIKKNKVYHLHANIDNAFSSVYFGHGESSYSLYFKIDNTNISFMANGNIGTELPHGLTLDTYIDLLVIVGDKSTGTLIFNTLGGTYTRSVQIVNGCKGDIFARPSDCTITKVYIEFTSADYRQPIWIFGDSYVTHTSNTRWPYWLIEWGFGRCLLNGFPGENSAESFTQVQTYLGSAGIPKYIVWCLGMNDPDNGAINASWLSNVTNLISECEKYKIIPILSTIPNVPNYDHSYKNAWVKQSGYRYIDFAKAVNAESTGATWYNGALSSDNTHPTEIGARLLCEQVMLDVPELMLGNI